MSFFLKLCALSVLLFSLCTPAMAQPDQNAFQLFVAGDYEGSAKAAEIIGDAQSLALAARALNAAAYLERDDQQARLIAKRALGYAKEAISLDPRLVEAKLQAAISYAQRSARMSLVRAFLSGNANKARDLLDEALTIEPENPWALSSSAAWHLEVARQAGVGRYGSDPVIGHEQFSAARALDPDNLLICYEAALRILSYNDPEKRAYGLSALEAAIDLQPKDAFENSIQQRAEAFQAAIETDENAERAFIKAQP